MFARTLVLALALVGSAAASGAINEVVRNEELWGEWL